MIQIEERKNKFKNRNVLVVGLARSGIGAANILSILGAKVTITDRKSRDSLLENIRSLWPSVEIVTGGNPENVFQEADMIIVSPGVPMDLPQLVRAKEMNIPVLGELELSYEIIASGVLGITGRAGGVSKPGFLGVTGTNGKSTTTTLVDLMLRESGLRTLFGGNIGRALTEELGNLNAGHENVMIDYIVAEISSFQLETIHDFRPDIAAILNITPDHLDRYRSFEDYVYAKSRIAENQTGEDVLVLNADDPIIMNLYHSRWKTEHSTGPRILFFSRREKVKGLYCREGAIYSTVTSGGEESDPYLLLPANQLRIQGVHNLENAMAASLVCLTAGCGKGEIAHVLKTFNGLEHRIEFVADIKGVTFINDSKGTNVGAVARSLEGFDRVILIMGGRDKGSDFSVLREIIAGRVKLLILIGEAKERIKQSLKGVTEILLADNLEEAVELSASRAVEGDMVLLSPGCASFDMFRDFEERGRSFKELVVRKVNEREGRHEA